MVCGRLLMVWITNMRPLYSTDSDFFIGRAVCMIHMQRFVPNRRGQETFGDFITIRDPGHAKIIAIPNATARFLPADVAYLYLLTVR